MTLRPLNCLQEANRNTSEVHNFQKLIDEFQSLDLKNQRFRTVHEIEGYAHYESVSSNLLGFFADPAAPHGTQDLVLRALIPEHLAGPLSNVAVERERLTDSGKKIDIWIETDSHLVVIENKIFHRDSNPFEDYAAYALSKAGARTVIKVFLAFQRSPEAARHGFQFVPHLDFIEKIRNGLGRCVSTGNLRYILALSDYLETIENLARRDTMDSKFVAFAQKNGEALVDIQRQIKRLRNDLKVRIEQVGALVDAAGLGVSEGRVYQEREELYAVWYYDITHGSELRFAVDATLSLDGWSFTIFVRPDQARFTNDLGMLIRSTLIDASLGSDGRFECRKKFPFEADIGDVAAELFTLLKTLVDARVH